MLSRTCVGSAGQLSRPESAAPRSVSHGGTRSELWKKVGQVGKKRPSAGRISRGRKSLVTGPPRALGQATPMFESFCKTRSIEYRGGSGFSMGDKSRTGEGWSRQSGVIYVSDSAPFFSFLSFPFLSFYFSPHFVSPLASQEYLGFAGIEVTFSNR